MFTPKVFAEHNIDNIASFIKSYPLATVIARTENGMEASHIPMYWQDNGTEHGCLYGHITITNPLNVKVDMTSPWLVIFQESGHYITPNWYPSKATTHKAVPTWNYQAVHVTGQVEVLTQCSRIIEILTHQTADFEASQPIPWSLKDAPEKYIQAMTRAIVGIRVDITDIQAQF